MSKEEKYRSDADEILAEFSKSLRDIPETKDLVYHDLDMRVVYRSDSEPIKKDTKELLLRICPKKDEKGHILAERAKL